MTSYKEIKIHLKKKVMQRLEEEIAVGDEETKEIIDSLIMEFGKIQFLTLSEKGSLSKELFYEIRKLDILEELIQDKEVTEIMINGMDGIFVEKKGRLFQWDKKFENTEKIQDIIQQMVSKCNRVVNESSPIVDARLENGARVNIVLSPVALNGPIVTIRRFPDKPIQMKDLISFGSIESQIAEFLRKLVIAGYNIFISGGTGSGKTTFLNALSNYIPKEERIITIEDSAELQLQNAENLVRLETRNANVENCKEITIRDLIKSSLRMRPDRIIVGEVRGGEAIDMIQCLNTGHDGSLSTGHANSAKDMLNRLETMVLMGIDLPLAAIRRQIASGVDIIVHLGRIRDRSRKVLEIAEIRGIEHEEIQIEPLYLFRETGESENGKIEGRLEKVSELQNKGKWEQAGKRVFELPDE